MDNGQDKKVKKERILFSSIGRSDPVKKNHDGPMLHICRHRLPDKVYLFLSKETTENQKKDDRYRKTIKFLEENLKENGKNHEFKVIPIETKLVDVQKFDETYKIFMDKVEEITRKHPDADILLNVSSGTPAMKNALQIIAALSDKYTAVQVSDPAPVPNKKESSENSNYDVETEWKGNKDNGNSECRVSDSPYLNFFSDIQKRMILKHIEVYDYEAAYSVLENSNQIKSNTILYHLLKSAKERIHLACDRATDELEKLRSHLENNNISDDAANENEGDKMEEINASDISSIIPNKNNKGKVQEKYELIDYLMWLQIKQERKDYSDFIRGITPALSALCRKILLTYNIKIDKEFTCDDTFYNQQLPSGKLVKEIIGTPKYIMSENLIKLIEDCTKNSKNSKTNAVIQRKDKILKIVKDIREIETSIRNKCAHNIIEVTDESIKAETQKNSRTIICRLKTLAIAVIKTSRNEFKAYRRINDLIKKELNLL